MFRLSLTLRAHLKRHRQVSVRRGKNRLLRTVPTFATTHTFCADRDAMKKSGFLTVMPAKTALFFAWFITTCKKQIFARVVGIRKEK